MDTTRHTGRSCASRCSGWTLGPPGGWPARHFSIFWTTDDETASPNLDMHTGKAGRAGPMKVGSPFRDGRQVSSGGRCFRDTADQLRKAVLGEEHRALAHLQVGHRLRPSVLTN